MLEKPLCLENLSSAYRELLQAFLQHLPNIIWGSSLFLMFWLSAVLLSQLVYRIVMAECNDLALSKMSAKLVKVSIIVFGLVTGLGTMGVDITALVAGLGLSGFALGLALKEIISNTISGALLIIYRPFKSGDFISVSSYAGTILSLDLRYTILESKDGEKINIPNNIVFNNTIKVKQASK